VKARCGRPFGHAYAQLQKGLFIQNLLRARSETSREPSAMFVQQDFSRAFFRPNIIFADWLIESPPLLRSITTDLTTNIEQQQQQDPAPSLPIASVIPSTHGGNNFDVPREFTMSPTSTSISSRRSYISGSPSAIGTVHSSPRLQSLTSQFMNTEIEADFREYDDHLMQNSQVIESTNAVLDFIPLVDSPQNMYEDNSEYTWERGSNVTTILGSDRGSWVSESSTIVASEENEPEGLISTIKDQQHRSYLQSHQMRRFDPVLRRPNAQTSADERVVRRKKRNNYRSLLAPRPRINKHAGTRQGRRRFQARSFLTTYQDIPEHPRSPKGKDIVRDMIGISSQSTQRARSILIPKQVTQAGESSRPRGPALIQSDSSTQDLEHNGATAWAMQSYLELDDDDQDEQNLSYPQSPKGKGVLRPALLDIESRSSSAVEFFEYNGMKLLPKSTTNLNQYLKRRKGWIGMVSMDGELKSLRLDYVARYMENRESENSSQTFILVKQLYAERFRTNYFKERTSQQEGEAASIL